MARFNVRLGLYLTVFSSVLFAMSETQEALLQLNTELGLTAKMARHIEKHHRSRLAVIETAIKRVQSSIQTNGLAHSMTIREYQNLIVVFRYSLSYFNQIRSAEIAPAIDALCALSEKIAQQRGFDDSPYTQITASVYSQMHKVFLQLESLTQSEELKAKINELKAPLGQVIAIGKQGDRLRTLINAIPLYYKVRSLYSDFNALQLSDAIFSLSLEIQGLNEFFAEFSQLERLDETELTILVNLLLRKEPKLLELLHKIEDESTGEERELIHRILEALKTTSEGE